MMHNHDQEKIMALAEGSLSPTAAAAAEVEIAACAECLRDLELQRIALATLTEAPRVYLSATESARLHDRLHKELAVSAPEPVRTRSQPAWGRWIGLAAAAAAVFLAIFMVLPSVLGGGDDADTVAFDQISEDFNEAGRSETTSAAMEAAPPLDEEMASADDMTLAGDGAASITESPAATTTAAAETTAGPSTEDPRLDTSNYLEYFVLGDLTEDLRFEILDQLQAEGQFFKFGDENVKRIKPDWELCVAATLELGTFPADSDPQIIGVLEDDSGEDAGLERLLVAFVTADPNDTMLASITLPECTVYQTLP